MRRVTIRRGSLPAVIGGAVVVSVVVAVAVAAVSGGDPAGQPPAGSAPGASAAASASATGTARSAGTSMAGMLVNLPAAGAHVPRGGDVWGRGSAIPTTAPPATQSGSTAAPGAPTATTGTTTGAGTSDTPGSPPRQLIVPDVIAAAPGGISAAAIARIKGLSQVRQVLPIDGARITVDGQPVNVLAAPAARLREWTPPATAASATLWADFARGDLITTAAAAQGIGLRPGEAYPVQAATSAQLTFGTQALLGVPGVDGVLNEAEASRLGLVKNVAVLINAPAASMDGLTAQVRRILGSDGQAVRLVPEAVTTRLPVATHVPTGRPTNYMMLYQESAARYCSGLSWTVLAAIGEIESNNGQNMGPSSAGALGPMQFMPATWAVWGIDGFGDTGTPNIWNPFDAVPSAARMLCADGAGRGGASLSAAIFDYNHATWYVDEVLTLAGEYAREYG